MNISTNTFSSFLGKPRRSKFGLGGFLFLCLFGVIFAGGGWLFIKDDVLTRSWPTTTGRVVTTGESIDSKGKVMYSPTVEYTVDGKVYRAKSSYSSSSRVEPGQAQQVAYEVTNPANGKLRISGAEFILYFFPLIGIAVVAGGIAAYINSLRRGSNIARLVQTGQKVTGVMTGLTGGGSKDSSMNVIVSATDTTGMVREFKSDSITGNIFGALDYRANPIAIDVYIDPSNPENYYVDLSDLPQLTPEKIASMLQDKTSQINQTPPNTPSAQPRP